MKNKIYKSHIFIIPLILTLGTYFIYQGCSGFFCVISGYGYPLPYIDDYFSITMFGIDYLFAWIAYMVVFLGITLLSRAFKKGMDPKNFN